MDDDIVRITQRVVLPGTIDTIETVVRIELTPEQLARVRAGVIDCKERTA